MRLHLEDIWQQCLSQVQQIVNKIEFEAWIKPLRPILIGEMVNILAYNRFTYDFVTLKYWDKISAILKLIINDDKIGYLLVMQDSANDSSIHTPDIKEKAAELVESGIFAQHVIMQPKNNSLKICSQLHVSTKLNKAYTFSSLIMGNSNQLAYAVGMHTTQNPGNRNHNPLFIYGGVGLGKTHLMQAIGNEVYNKNPNAKIRYLHANDYIQDVVQASMRQGFNELKKYYNGLDLLLMDDIQFIGGDKTKTQEEFFYTFNNLLDNGRQVIMTCDTYPKNISNLNERLVSRFTAGITVEVQPPELSMRVAILKKKALRNDIELADEVACFIAQNIQSNVRELEGALNKVLYYAKFYDKLLSVTLAHEALLDIITKEPRRISIDDIQKIVCGFYNILVSDLLSAKRNAAIVRPRQIAMTLAKEFTQYKLPVIGEAFGGRDHTTVLHAQRTIHSLRDTDDKINRDYKLLTQLLQN